jgi:hypothetical protein
MTTQQPIHNEITEVKYTPDVKHVDSVEDARDTDSEIKDNAVRPSYDDIDDGFDPKMIKKLVRKIDLHVIPILALMYCISLIDRTNLSMARAANNKAMNKELGLDVGNRYSLATMIFFIPYIVLEIPVSVKPVTGAQGLLLELVWRLWSAPRHTPHGRSNDPRHSSSGEHG